MSEQTVQTPPAAPAPDAAPPAATPPMPADTTEPATEPTPTRPPRGALVRFDTTDPITALRLQGVGIVVGYVEDVDAAGNPVGPVRTRVVPLPADYLLLGDDELVTGR